MFGRAQPQARAMQGRWGAGHTASGLSSDGVPRAGWLPCPPSRSGGTGQPSSQTQQGWTGQGWQRLVLEAGRPQ